MKRSDLVHLLASRFPTLAAIDADLSVKEITDAIAETLARGGRVEIRGFGVFTARLRSARVSRNPKTGVKVNVPPKYVPSFKAGKELRERISPPMTEAERRAA